MQHVWRMQTSNLHDKCVDTCFKRDGADREILFFMYAGSSTKRDKTLLMVEAIVEATKIRNIWWFQTNKSLVSPFFVGYNFEKCINTRLKGLFI